MSVFLLAQASEFLKKGLLETASFFSEDYKFLYIKLHKYPEICEQYNKIYFKIVFKSINPW